MSRAYKQTRRAEAAEDTRLKITEAAVALHEELGPAATSISAIAERAGVQRLTVYRHFPDEAALYQACSSHWEGQNPPPDPAAWADAPTPEARIRRALTAFYGYFRDTAGMMRGVYRDRAKVAPVEAIVSATEAQLAHVADDLAAGYGRRASKARARTLRHALKFQTWMALADDGLSEAEMVDLVMGWLG